VSVPGTVQTISTNVTLTQGTQVVTQTGPVNEGNSFNFTVSTTGIAAGFEAYFRMYEDENQDMRDALQCGLAVAVDEVVRIINE
jgi:hypothetical protein